MSSQRVPCVQSGVHVTKIEGNVYLCEGTFYEKKIGVGLLYKLYK